jgi:hypothetical protein
MQTQIQNKLPATARRVVDHGPKSANRKIEEATLKRIARLKDDPQQLKQRLKSLDHEWDIERTLELACAAGLVSTGRSVPPDGISHPNRNRSRTLRAQADSARTELRHRHVRVIPRLLIHAADRHDVPCWASTVKPVFDNSDNSRHLARMWIRTRQK